MRTISPRQSSGLAAVALGFALALPAARAADEGHGWALLIGVERYQKVSPLRCTANDARVLADTLRTRGGFEAGRVKVMTDDASEAASRPTAGALRAAVPKFLKRPAPGDRIVVFFSGHGFRDAEGRLYLAPADFDPAAPAATGLPVEWLRGQLASCGASLKLLILDACHAGSEKGGGGPEPGGLGVAAGALGEPFRDLTGVVTLASSAADQKSQVWAEKERSLFSYWLAQGLNGHADADLDGAVDVDEMNAYVHRNVTRTAAAKFPHPQTPVRVVRSGTPGVPLIVRLTPQRLRTVLGDVADQLAEVMEARRLGRVGVPEFTAETTWGEALGADFGLLGRWCAEELERALVRRARDSFQVVDRRRLQEALRSQRFTIRDLSSGPALRGLSGRLGGMPALAQGTLRGRSGRVISLQCRLVRTEGDELVVSAGGTALLSESEWAMLGRSAAVGQDDRRPELPRDEAPGADMEDRVVERLDRRARETHPMSDPDFPFRIRIKVGGRERRGTPRGNDWVVPLRVGEVYEVEVENRSDRVVCMRLLVDGLNTLPELEPVKGVSTTVWGKRVSLDEARHFVLDPRFSKVYAVRGFITETGPRGKLREFTVAEASQSLAGRQKFSDQLGVITAAFYAAAGSRQAVGTAAGRERAERLIELGTKVGDLLAVVHIRYINGEPTSNSDYHP